ncbi:MAG: ribosome-associated translation inhibitor RaiA [Flavobacteriales bacterium]|nr:ribosome-associated translation inhibitor RaiA [Flavobacteriales bacterium]
MKSEIQSIHFKADQKLKDYIDQKLDKLNRYYDGIVDAQVFLKLENNHSVDNKTIEVKLNVHNSIIMKTQTSQTFEAATDLAVDALKVQIKRYKERVQSVS